MGVYVKSLWSEREKKLIYDGEYPETKNPAELRYTIREKAKKYIAELTDALTCEHVKHKRLVLPVLSMAEEVLKANGYDAEAAEIRNLRLKLYEKIVAEVIKL